MFNHQAQGVPTPQMIHMQRLMGNRTQRTAAGSTFFGANEVDMTTPMDLNDQYPMGMNSQRNFGSFGLQNHHMMPAGFANHRNVEMGNFPGMMGHGSSGAQLGMGSTSGEFIGSVGSRMPVFKCPECSITKNTNEELEIHIKTEHLGWLPFQCPICTALRASDIQMREHIHSHHKKNENKYYYFDNPQAKRLLQEMMDRALFGASQQIQQQMAKRGNSVGGGQQHITKKPRIDEQNMSADMRNTSNTTAMSMSSIRRTGGSSTGIAHLPKQKSSSNTIDQKLSEKSIDGTHENESQRATNDQTVIDEDADAQLLTVYGRKVKSEFDMATMDGQDGCSPDEMNDDEDNLPDDDNSHQQMDALQNVSAMFSASDGSDKMRNFNNNEQQQGFYRRIVRNRPGPMTSKKRVLGLCADCKKPITAGARQMHMFFHLGKDQDTYRFRCKHQGCRVQHYRKDQMENHQSKAHGKVDADMMEDRSMELYNLVQEMSMKLLGTAGNTPGPTAAKAQLLYDQQMREMEANLGVRKRRRPDYFDNSYAATNSNNNQPMARRSSGLPAYDAANRKIEDLECRLCDKFILNRTKGFHILWHLSTDLGIIRYGCKHCNFKHDRPQSVAAHGAREHGDEGACEDLLYDYEDDLKAMSKACFGVERLFEKEIRRRNKLERNLRANGNSPINGDDDTNSPQGIDNKLQLRQQMARRSQQIANLKIALKAENASDRNWTPKEPVRKRRSGARRFGVRSVEPWTFKESRKPMSRKARDAMVKLREVSMRLGGAQYVKKRSNEAVPCEKCNKLVVSRLSDHAYSHMEGCELFRCQLCHVGHYARETIIRHLKDFHNSHEAPMDNRLKFAQEIKDAIRECYPRLFVDAPIPTKEEVEQLRENLNLSDQVLVCEKDGEEDGKHSDEDGGPDDEDNEEIEDEEEEEKNESEDFEQEQEEDDNGDEEEEEDKNEEDTGHQSSVNGDEEEEDDPLSEGDEEEEYSKVEDEAEDNHLK